MHYILVFSIASCTFGQLVSKCIPSFCSCETNEEKLPGSRLITADTHSLAWQTFLVVWLPQQTQFKLLRHIFAKGLEFGATEVRTTLTPPLSWAFPELWQIGLTNQG